VRHGFSSKRKEVWALSPAVIMKKPRRRDHWRKVAADGKPDFERERQRRDAERSVNLLSDIAADALKAQRPELKIDSKSGALVHPPLQLRSPANW
jgi:hypothetical protein